MIKRKLSRYSAGKNTKSFYYGLKLPKQAIDVLKVTEDDRYVNLEIQKDKVIITKSDNN